MPTAFVAVTLKRYAVPFVRFGTVQWGAETAVQVDPPGMAVTVYLMIGRPPVQAGVCQETSADAVPVSDITCVGAPGTDAPWKRPTASPAYSELAASRAATRQLVSSAKDVAPVVPARSIRSASKQ